MNLKVAICDDNTKESALLKKYLIDYELNHEVDFEIDTYSSGDSLLKNYDIPGTYHIVFLDVEMPGKNGIDTASVIRRNGDNNVRIIFVSNYPKYMQDSFNVQAFNYLTKPVSFDDFSDILNRIIRSYKDSSTTKLIIPIEGKKELINTNDILYIESVKSRKNYLNFVLADHKIVCKGVLSEWRNDLGCHNFVTPFRGLLVNINHIHYINDDSLTLTTGIEIPLSRRYEKEIRTLFSKHTLTIHH